MRLLGSLSLAGILATLFVPSWVPPWPARLGIAAILLAFLLLVIAVTPWRWFGKRRWLIACIFACLLFAGSLIAYGFLWSRFVVQFKDAPHSPVIVGHRLQPDVEEMRLSDPTRFTYEELLNLFERQPERICTPGSLTCVRLSFLTAWTAVWCSALAIAGAITLGRRAAAEGVLPEPMLGLFPIAGADNQQRLLDVVFIHGLDGNARTTWMSSQDDASFWPEWLAQDIPEIGVWTLGYAADISRWTNESMPLADRGTLLLEQLTSRGLGHRPLVFINHSMGGIVAKHVVRQSETYGVARFTPIAKNCFGFVFIATPHAGSALASFASLVRLVFRTNEPVEELSAHDAPLRDLHNWFRAYAERKSLRCRTYCERNEVREFCGVRLRKGFTIVNPTSAEPSLPGEVAIPLQEDHVTIAKPKTRQADLYQSILAYFYELITAIRRAQ